MNYFLPTEVNELVEFLVARLECLLWGLRGLERKMNKQNYGSMPPKHILLLYKKSVSLKRKHFSLIKKIFKLEEFIVIPLISKKLENEGRLQKEGKL